MRASLTAGLLALFALASLTVRGVEQTTGGANGEAVLTELQQTLAKAWVGGDRATIERIIAADWTITGLDGRLTDRAAILAEVFETRRHKIQKVEIDDVRARVYGDAAVVTGRTHGVGEFEGSAYDVVIRFTDTFVRRDGRWQAVASHVSLITDRTRQ